MGPNAELALFAPLEGRSDGKQNHSHKRNRECGYKNDADTHDLHLQLTRTTPLVCLTLHVLRFPFPFVPSLDISRNLIFA